MRNIIFVDDADIRRDLLPLSMTRPVAAFRVGITTIADKWLRLFADEPVTTSHLTLDYLAEKFPLICDDTDPDNNYWITSHILPIADESFATTVASMQPGDALADADGATLLYRGSREEFESREFKRTISLERTAVKIKMIPDIFINNGHAIIDDLNARTNIRERMVPESNTIIGPRYDTENRPMVIIEDGATVQGAFLNTTGGPIYIGPGATIMEGSCLRGPVAICTHATVNMGSKIYPDTTIGPWCKVGGEINNVVMFGYSNKAHDGFLGNAVIGEWCNLGAGCVASNLKNNYSEIKLWNYRKRSFVPTGLQFCGLIMGDHSKAGINVMFNTATVTGVGDNIFGGGFPRTHIPSFKMGGHDTGLRDITPEMFFDTAERVMARRRCELTDVDRRLYLKLFELAATDNL